MEIELAVAKINKYATSESGDSVEVVERPNGGISVVMADGQSSGKGAKQISSLVVRKVISLLSEGVRDGAAASAALGAAPALLLAELRAAARQSRRPPAMGRNCLDRKDRGNER